MHKDRGDALSEKQGSDESNQREGSRLQPQAEGMSAGSLIASDAIDHIEQELQRDATERYLRESMTGRMRGVKIRGILLRSRNCDLAGQLHEDERLPYSRTNFCLPRSSDDQDDSLWDSKPENA